MITARWWPSVGGIETHARQWARWLQAQGVVVEILCLDDDPELRPFEARVSEDEGLRVTRVAYRYEDHETYEDLAYNARLEEVAEAWALERSLELIHIHHLTGWGHGLVGTLAEHAPVVLTLHDYWTVCPRGQLWSASGECCPGPSVERCTPCLTQTWPHLSACGRGEAGALSDADSVGGLIEASAAAFERASALLVPSEPARRVLVKAGVPRERLAVFSLGVDCEVLSAEVERLRVDSPPRGDRRVGVLGAVQPTKGVLELAQAVLECAVPGLALHIHGPLESFHGDISYVDELRELAARHEAIQLCGPYDPAELPEVLASLDAVAAPARWEEGFGLSVREASAVGLPVIVSDAGGLPELVERDGAVGVIAHRADPRSLVEALRWMDSTDSFGPVPDSARPKLPGIDEMADELSEVYERVLAAHASQASSSADADAPQE